MEIIIVLIPLTLILAGFFIFAFIWSARKGQYDDLETPRFRMLLDDQSKSKSQPIVSTIKDIK